MSDAPQPVISRPCPLCDQADCAEFLEKGSLRLVQCRRCMMVYANPIDAELASGQFYDRLSLPFYLSADKLAGDYAPVRFEREIRLFRRYCGGGGVLDVGCSTGGFLFQLRNRFPGAYQVIGCDVASGALDYAESRGIPVIRAAFPDFDFGGREFDAITFWAVMEHLAQPRRFLTRAASTLKPGGYCFILVPNLRSLAARILGARYRYIMPDHINYFTTETLRRFIVEEPTLEVIELGSCHFNPVVILQDLRSRKTRVDDSDRARLLKRTTDWKQRRLLRPLKWLYARAEDLLAAARLADNLVIVARKRGHR